MPPCLGCGLRENGDDVEVSTSGIFGEGDLAGFGSDDTVGAPIYCSADGTIRTVPVFAANAAGGSSSSQVGAAFSGAVIATGPTVHVDIANPSLVRPANLLAIVTVKWQLAVTTPGLAMFANVVAGGVDLGDFIAKYLGIPGVYSTEEILTDSTIGSILAGGTFRISVTPRVEAAGGEGRFTAQGVGVRAMVVSQ